MKYARQPHVPYFDHANILVTWVGVHIMNLITLRFYPAFQYFQTLWPKKRKVSTLSSKALGLYCYKGKGKSIPVQACTGPEGSRRLRLPDFKIFGT
jgi:hypothetical protein